MGIASWCWMAAGTHLADRGNDISDSLWSARILRDNPDEVRAAHEDFFRSGAQVASTCSYQVTFDGLAQVGASFTKQRGCCAPR